MNIQKVIVNTSSQLAGRLVSVAISLAATILLRRYLGRNEYGIYIYLTNIVLIGVSLADMGTYLTSVRESCTSIFKSTKVLGEAVVLRGLLGILAGIIVLWLQPILKLPFPPYVILLSLSLLLNLSIFKESLAMLFHALEKLYVSSAIQASVSVINFAVIVLVILFKQSLEVIFWGNAIGITLLLIPLFNYVTSHTLVKLSFNFYRMKQLFLKSLPLGGVLFLFTVYSRIDSFIINYYFGSEAVGVYGVAYKIYDNLALPAAYLLNALLPEMSRLAALESAALKKLCANALVILAGLSVVIIAFIYVAAPFIINVVTGEPAAGEIQVLRILTIATLFAYANHVTGYAVIALGQQQKSLMIAVIALVFNGLANYLLLPRYGVYISAILTIATEALVLVLSGWVVIRHLKPLSLMTLPSRLEALPTGR